MKRIVKKPEIRRQEIVDTAKNLFLRKGYEQSTMQDVMKQLEIAKGTIYHYFKSKEELLEAVVHMMADDYFAKVRKIVDETEGDAVKRLNSFFNAANVEDDEMELLEQMHSPGNIGLHTRQLAVTLTKLAPLLAEIIEQGVQEKVFKVKHALETAELILGGGQFMIDRGCYPWKQEDIDRRKKALPYLLETLLITEKGIFDES